MRPDATVLAAGDTVRQVLSILLESVPTVIPAELPTVDRDTEIDSSAIESTRDSEDS
ncbi:hypothetical protein [Nocardia sp. NPDC003963]